jgi:hypothetical protein
MDKKLPPLPWSYEANAYGMVYLVDANGRKIAALYCSPEEKISLAEFICDASAKATTSTEPTSALNTRPK